MQACDNRASFLTLHMVSSPEGFSHGRSFPRAPAGVSLLSRCVRFPNLDPPVGRPARANPGLLSEILAGSYTLGPSILGTPGGAVVFLARRYLNLNERDVDITEQPLRCQRFYL